MALLHLIHSEILTALPLVLGAVDESPEPEDVKAGWVAFGLFGLLILAIAVLGFSLTKRLKNVAKAEEAGLYDPSTKKPRHNIPHE